MLRVMPAGPRNTKRPLSERCPLSASALDTYRCTSKSDFADIVSSSSAVFPHKTRGSASPVRRERGGHGYGYDGHDSADGDASVDDDDDDDDDDYTLNCVSVLDAIDKQQEFAELQAIGQWLDDVRMMNGYRVTTTDVDLSNGVALLDALYIIQPSLFEPDFDETQGVNEDPDEQTGATKDAKSPTYVERQLDPAGEAAARNITRLRDALTRFPWRDMDGERAPIEPIDFSSVDTWALGGYVVLAAVNCDENDEFVRQMLAYEDRVRDELDDVVTRGLQAFGLRHIPTPEKEEATAPRKRFSCNAGSMSSRATSTSAAASGVSSSVALSAAGSGSRSGSSSLLETVRLSGGTRTSRVRARPKSVRREKPDDPDRVQHWRSLTAAARAEAMKMRKERDELASQLRVAAAERKEEVEGLRKRLDELRAEGRRLRAASHQSRGSGGSGSGTRSGGSGGAGPGPSPSPSALGRKNTEAPVGTSVVRKLAHERAGHAAQVQELRRENAALRRKMLEQARQMELAQKSAARAAKAAALESRRPATGSGKRGFKREVSR